MRTSRLVATLAIGPLALVLAVLVGRESVEGWMQREPVVVVTGQVGTAHTAGGPTFTVESARLVAPDDEDAGYADAPDGSQVVVVDVRVDDADDILAWCTYRLEATVDGVRSQWLWDGGATEISGCYAEEGSLAGPIGFVLPAGNVSDARLLVGGESIWLGVPLTL